MVISLNSSYLHYQVLHEKKEICLCPTGRPQVLHGVKGTPDLGWSSFMPAVCWNRVCDWDTVEQLYSVVPGKYRHMTCQATACQKPCPLLLVVFRVSKHTGFWVHVVIFSYWLEFWLSLELMAWLGGSTTWTALGGKAHLPPIVWQDLPSCNALLHQLSCLSWCLKTKTHLISIDCLLQEIQQFSKHCPVCIQCTPAFEFHVAYTAADCPIC